MEAAVVELDSKWEIVRKKLRAELGEDVYSSWFTRMMPENFDGANLTVSVPTRFLRSWIQSHYRDNLLAGWKNEISTLARVDILVRTCSTRQAPSPNANLQLNNANNPLEKSAPNDWSGKHNGLKNFGHANPMAAGNRPGEMGGHGRARGRHVDPRQSFDTFVVGDSNALAFQAAKRVADGMPNEFGGYRPLFIYGEPGLGKTHLLNAVRHQIMVKYPERKMLYLTAEEFIVQFVNALKNRDTLSFKEKIRSVDLLLIDDLQFLQGEKVQEEFDHTFTSLVEAGKQVVLAADQSPIQLSCLNDRMRSRLSGGLVIDICPNDFELRVRILKAKVAEAQRVNPTLAVPADVLQYIAENASRCARGLEGGLVSVLSRAQNGVITLDMARSALRNQVSVEENRIIRVHDIIKSVSEFYQVSKADLFSARRHRSIVRPRQIGMYLAKMLTSRSLPEIGRRFGGRDHTTVLHAVRKIDDLLKKDPILAEEVTRLKREIETGDLHR
ncbi:MAG: chromosomal replication initiator protein DnaA [Rhizobiales bacterium]|nr:chromosomal replication initiator protein DnaA [Hyphomicrobiales bacterium]NRB14210.1 chromosomal replication initiator protein DnaA [Hyphomicrobiales bacterium]